MRPPIPMPLTLRPGYVPQPMPGQSQMMPQPTGPQMPGQQFDWTRIGDAFARNSNTLTSTGLAILGGGIGAAADGYAQGQRLDLYQQDRENAAQTRNATVEWLRQQGATDLLAGLESGAIDPSTAFSTYLERQQEERTRAEEAQRRGQYAAFLQDPQLQEMVSSGALDFESAYEMERGGGDLTDTQRNLMWRAREAGLEPGTPEYQSFIMSGGSGGTSLTVDPATGAVQFMQGGGFRPLTEQQSKDTVYATRAAGALPIINEYEEQLTNPVMRAVEGDPTGVARGNIQSPEFQQAQQAGLEFLQAILRKDTGAAITAQEQQEYGRVYLPIPGDSPRVIQQKREARARALAAIEAGLPPAAILAQEEALRRAGAGSVDDPEVDALVEQYLGGGM